ncbi:hypothetical protein GH733_014105 [Mirounga leonina]|nr:hypothetical protein GH733_014105 [Mirounga leonina]
MELVPRTSPVSLLLLLLLGLSTVYHGHLCGLGIYLDVTHSLGQSRCASVSGAITDRPTEEGKEVWDYVTIRKDAHMFWWLYYATNPCKNFSELPLVMWLQLQSASLLFVDNPVGTGFSYVNKSDAYAKDLATVASDMMVLLKTFFDCHKEFQTIPFYIFSESYGGKMAAGIGLELYKAIQQGTIQCNFAGVALGDSWISPVDSVLSWGPFLYSMVCVPERCGPVRSRFAFQSLLDDQGLAEVSQVAEDVLDAVNKGLYKEATQLWGKAEMVIEQNTDGVNFYNILTKSTPTSAVKSSLEFTQIPLDCRLLPLSLSSRAGQSADVFQNMEGDFMKPVISIVDELLEAGVNVTIYNGQLDLIVDTIGQEAWVRKLKWAELPKFNQLKWKAVYSDPNASETSAFLKSYKNLAFYWILRAGHMIKERSVSSDSGTGVSLVLVASAFGAVAGLEASTERVQQMNGQ